MRLEPRRLEIGTAPRVECSKDDKKRGVPDLLGEDTPRYSFPQICVVPGNSVCESEHFNMVKIAHFLDYGSRVSIRNLENLLIDKEYKTALAERRFISDLWQEAPTCQ